MTSSAFHLSLPCLEIKETQKFYAELVGASIGRQSSNWVDIDLFGHQITFTQSGSFKFDFKPYKLDDTVLPSFHFGLIVEKETWLHLLSSLKERSGRNIKEVKFLKDKKGEHSSFFVDDPNGYTLEFKCFSREDEIFAS